ncbi:hypothetical protein SAMN05421809_2683 [Natronorubrum daqingense]|uniref:Uncharacterized protein n=1 Tax=Natronorubrum daqingense TaxID=588898 RepID=A0A1N7ELG0_9EURY|nr:hypothetical protein SAMN05421809_2683 [Natronorubrum daqingense]
MCLIELVENTNGCFRLVGIVSDSSDKNVRVEKSS